jgi:DNA invertase Pin-like site-specific DNA recombinase
VLPAGPLLDGSLGDDPLAAEPALTGALIGYARVSTGAQRLDRQLAALETAGCTRIFADKKSGKDVEREELWKALDYMRPGDTLVVPSLDRLGRSLQDLISIVAGLRRRGIGFRSLHEAIDTTTPGGRLVFHVFAALAEFIRELIVQGTNEGLAAARARGQRLGRPPALTPDQVRQARALLTRPDESVSSIARLLGVSRSTLYKHVPEAKGRPRAVQPPAVDEAAVNEVEVEVVDGIGSDPTGHRSELDTVLATLPPDTRPAPSVAPYDQLLTRTADRDQGDPGQDDVAEQQQEEERRWRRALKPIAVDVAGAEGYQGAVWPDGWRRFHVVAPGGERIGHAEQDDSPHAWQARREGRLVQGRLPTRARAVAELVRRHRERTPATDSPVPGLEGWRLTQTLDEQDRHRYRLIAPDGRPAGTVERRDWGGRPHWQATGGDPTRHAALRWSVTPYGDDPDAIVEEDAWRTRQAAVRALAENHDPDLTTA